MPTTQPNIVINPYASQITFPPGTPTSLINTILQMNAANKASGGAQAAPWWAQGFNSLINNVLTPYVQQELITTPYQQAQAQFKSALDVQQAQQIAQNAAQIKQNFENQGLTQQGSSLYDYTQALNTPIPATTTSTQTMGGAQPDLLEPTTPAPLPPSQVTPQTTGTSNIFTATPERKPTTLEAISQIAGTGAAGQLSAGQLLELLKNPQVSRVLNPDEAALYKQQLQNQNIQSQMATREGTLALRQEQQPGILAAQNVRNAQAQVQTDRIRQLMNESRIADELKKAAIDEYIETGDMTKVNNLLTLSKGSPFAGQGQEFGKQAALEKAILTETDPTKRALLEQIRARAIEATGQKAAASTAGAGQAKNTLLPVGKDAANWVGPNGEAVDPSLTPAQLQQMGARSGTTQQINTVKMTNGLLSYMKQFAELEKLYPEETGNPVTDQKNAMLNGLALKLAEKSGGPAAKIPTLEAQIVRLIRGYGDTANAAVAERLTTARGIPGLYETQGSFRQKMITNLEELMTSYTNLGVNPPNDYILMLQNLRSQVPMLQGVGTNMQNLMGTTSPSKGPMSPGTGWTPVTPGGP